MKMVDLIARILEITRSDARRRILGGSIRINNVKVTDPDAIWPYTTDLLVYPLSGPTR